MKIKAEKKKKFKQNNVPENNVEPKINDIHQKTLDILNNSKEASLDTPPLPPQPAATQVASATTTPINTATGLTRVETALLSPGEQAIRLKQRA